MEKTIPPRSKIFGFLCVLLLCFAWLPLPVVGQCPQIERSNFTQTLVQPNADCNTPGTFSIRYNNNVVGVDKMHYQFGTSADMDAPDDPFYETDAIPGAAVKVDIPVSLNGKRLYVRILMQCGYDANMYSWEYGSISALKAEKINLLASTTPAGNGVGTSGSVQARLEGIAGFSEATFRLYKQDDPTTEIASQRSTRPYDGVTFMNLAKGNYVVKAEAKPECTPSTSSANWKTDHFELTSNVTVGTFNLIATPISARGTCAGGVKAEVSKVSGVQDIEYTVAAQSAPDTPLQTFTVSYPKFAHVFTNLSAGNYVLKATEKTGNSIITQPFEVKNGVDDVVCRMQHGTISGAADGVVNIQFLGTTEACPVKYTITRVGGDPLAFTPIVKNNVTEENLEVGELPIGQYEVKAEFSGGVKTARFEITGGSLGYLDNDYDKIVNAKKSCDPSGSYTWKLVHGLYYAPLKVKLTNNSTGSLVREFTLPAGQTEFTTGNLMPGNYMLTVRYDKANAEISRAFQIEAAGRQSGSLSYDGYSATFDFCGEKPMARIPVKMYVYGSEEDKANFREFLADATYEIYKRDGKTFVYSAPFPTLSSDGKGYIESPEINSGYQIVVKPSCGYPVLTETYYGNPAYEFYKSISYRGCGSTGTDLELDVFDIKRNRVRNITYRLKKMDTGALVTEYEMKGTEEHVVIPNVQPGSYLLEWFPQCVPNQLHTDTVEVENAVKEKSRTIVGASCGENGSITIQYTRLDRVAWRFELYRKSDNKLVRTYGSDGGSYVTFRSIPAGDYIVKVTPIVKCDEITPGVFEVTVPQKELRKFGNGQSKNPTPFKNDGAKSYYTEDRFEYVKWRVFDVLSGAEIGRGEAHPLSKDNNDGMFVPVSNLPNVYKIEFETPCGKTTYLDSIPVNLKGAPGFDVTVTPANKACGKKGSITVKSGLKAAGLPDMASKIVLYQSKVVDGKWGQYPIDSVTNLTSIIETHTFDNLDADEYAVRYIYNGTQYYYSGRVYNAEQLYLNSDGGAYGLKGFTTMTFKVPDAEKGTTMRLVVKNESGTEIFNDVVPADKPYSLRVKRQGTQFTAQATMIDGCHAGKSFDNRIYVGDNQRFYFYSKKNEMKCKNDGEITLMVPEYFQDVDQIHYTLTKVSGTTYTDVAETTTPSIPKKFIGLEAGTYKIKARVTVFKDENGQPQVQEFETTEQLSTYYREGLYATVRPDYMLPTIADCPAGRIGLNIEKGSGKYRVYIKSDPDGPLAQPKEIFTDSYGYGQGKFWGEGLKPGHYSLTVSDGCMERDIPDAEIPVMPNTPNYKWEYQYLQPDRRIFNKLDDTIDSIQYQLIFDPSQFPAGFQPNAYNAFEVQVVAKGEQPDDNQWKSNWSGSQDGRARITNYAKRFNNCNGVDVLFRFKNCPSSVTRLSDNIPIHNMFDGNWVRLNCRMVQWIFTSGDIGHEYHIRVKNTTDNKVVVEKDVTYHSREEYLHRDPNLYLPADKSYTFEMTPKDHCGDPLYYSGKSRDAIKNNYRYSLDYSQRIFSDCDGRLLEINADTDCPVPLKYYAYEVNGTQETLVAQSGNFLSTIWRSDYKFKKDKTYIIRIQEEGKLESDKIDLVKFTLNYRLPSKYIVNKDGSLSGSTFCGRGYDASKKGYHLNDVYHQMYASWEGVAPVKQDTYLTIPKMKVVITQKEAPHRKFIATKVTRWRGEIHTDEWKEELSDGSLVDAYAPDGEYSVVARTDCGDIPMEDDFLGRPTLDLSETTVEMACDGKFTVTPKGKLTYRGSTSDVEITSFYVKDDNLNTTRNWGQSFDTYQREFQLMLNIKRKSDGNTCTVSWPFSMSNYILDFDQSQALSMFCTDSGKGIIHIALKGGQPPYTYKLSTMDGTEIERKTVPGAVDFEHGTLGQRFRVTATDACNLTWIHQDVLLQDPAAVSSSMKTETSFCVGDHAKLSARIFPGATYLWHLPNGSTKAGRELEFEAKAENAGEYTVDIHLTTCTVTLYGKFTVSIASISEAAGLVLNQQSCAGEPVEFTLDPASATVDGVAADPDDIEYQWERTATPNDPESWTAIPNATGQSLTYTAAAPGVFYVRRTAVIGQCKAISGQSKLTVIPGINVAMTPDEQTVTINNKDPFTLTAGVVTGNPNRTYQWQRSVDKKTWVNIGTDETFTETKRYGNTVYYRRIVSAGACSIEGQPITVRFKKRWPAYINPQVRQRALED